MKKAASISTRRWCLFVYSTLLYFRVFAFRQNAPLVFFSEICGGIGNEMLRERKGGFN